MCTIQSRYQFFSEHERLLNSVRFTIYPCWLLCESRPILF